MATTFPIAGCIAVITGASSGLGEEFARQLSGKAECLVLAARSGEKLLQLAEELGKAVPRLRVITCACDLATAEGRELLWEEVDVLDVKPTLLVNNAGLGDYGAFLESEETRIRSQIDLNITALTLLTHEFLKRVQATAERPAAVLNVSSLAASTPMPDLAVYAGTKAYVTSFSEGLAVELAARHILVLAVCPGPTPTNFGKNAQRGPDQDTDRSGQDFIRMPADKVVSIALQSLEAGRRRVHPGIGVALAAFLFEKMPRWMLRAALTERHRRSLLKN